MEAKKFQLIQSNPTALSANPITLREFIKMYGLALRLPYPQSWVTEDAFMRKTNQVKFPQQNSPSRIVQLSLPVCIMILRLVTTTGQKFKHMSATEEDTTRRNGRALIKCTIDFILIIIFMNNQLLPTTTNGKAVLLMRINSLQLNMQQRTAHLPIFTSVFNEL